MTQVPDATGLKLELLPSKSEIKRATTLNRGIVEEKKDPTPAPTWVRIIFLFYPLTAPLALFYVTEFMNGLALTIWTMIYCIGSDFFPVTISINLIPYIFKYYYIILFQGMSLPVICKRTVIRNIGVYLANFGVVGFLWIFMTLDEALVIISLLFTYTIYLMSMISNLKQYSGFAKTLALMQKDKFSDPLDDSIRGNHFRNVMEINCDETPWLRYLLFKTDYHGSVSYFLRMKKMLQYKKSDQYLYIEILNNLNWVYNFILFVFSQIVTFKPISSHIDTGSALLLSMFWNHGYFVVTFTYFTTGIIFYFRLIWLNYTLNRESEEILNDIKFVINFYKTISAHPEILLPGFNLEPDFMVQSSDLTTEAIEFTFIGREKELQALLKNVKRMFGKDLKYPLQLAEFRDHMIKYASDEMRRLDIIYETFLEVSDRIQWKFLGFFKIDRNLLTKIIVAGVTTSATTVVGYVKANSIIQ